MDRVVVYVTSRTSYVNDFIVNKSASVDNEAEKNSSQKTWFGWVTKVAALALNQ